MIGIAILCYEGYKDLKMSLRAAKAHSVVPGESVEIIVFDNSEKTTEIRDYVNRYHPDVIYQTADPLAGHNVGCTASRNLIYSGFIKRHPDAKYLVILDQDIEVQSGWLVDMIAVAKTNKDCGIVAWPQAYRYKLPPVNGVVGEVASMCNLHVLAPLAEVKEKWGGPFDERFFIHRFDSLICQRLNQLNYRTRLVMRYYKSGVRWERQHGGIVHHHPHQGVRRNPSCDKIIRKSKRIYQFLQRTEGWTTWHPEAVARVSAKVATLADEVARQNTISLQAAAVNQRKAPAQMVNGVPRMVHGQRPTSPLPSSPPPRPPKAVKRKTLRQLLQERHTR